MPGHKKNTHASRIPTVRMELSRPLFRKLAQVAQYFHTTPATALFACISAMHTATVGPPTCDVETQSAPRRVHRAHSSPTPVADIIRTLSNKC